MLRQEGRVFWVPVHDPNKPSPSVGPVWCRSVHSVHVEEHDIASICRAKDGQFERVLVEREVGLLVLAVVFDGMQHVLEGTTFVATR